MIPVLTIVVYYGEKPWKSPVCLKDMTKELSCQNSSLNIFRDYPIHLLDVRRFPHLERFRTDIRYVFGFLQHSGSIDELQKYVQENREAMSSLEENAYDMIWAMSNSRQLKLMKEYYKTEERTCNMCRAIDQMVELGRKEGTRDTCFQNARMFFKNGVSLDLVASCITQISSEELEKIYREELAISKASVNQTPEPADVKL